MRQRGLLGAFMMLFLLQGAVGAQGSGGEEYVPGELLIKFKPEVTSDAIAALQAEVGLETIKVFKRTGVHHVKILASFTVPEVIAQLQQHPAIEYAEPNYVRRLNRAPTDLHCSERWGLHTTGQTEGTANDDSDPPEACDPRQTGILHSLSRA